MQSFDRPKVYYKPIEAMSNETKVGILAIVAIALSYWGYKFIMGKNVLMNSNVYYAEYEDVNMLQLGTPVTISGVTQGNVASIQVNPDKPKSVIIMIDMNDDIKIPKGAKAVIAEQGVMGGKAVIIEYDEICTGDDCAQSGDYLQGVTRTFIQTMLQADEMGNFMGDVTTGLKEVLNDQIGPESETDLAKSLRSLSTSLDNIKGITFKMDVLLDRSSGKIDGTLANIQSITKNLDDNKKRINNILGHVDTFSNQLTKIELEAAVTKANKAIEALSTTLQSTNKAVDNVNDLVDKVNTGDGTLAKLIKDDQLYNDLDRLSKSIDSLANDFQTRPYRYMPFKSRRKVKKNDKKDAKEAASNR